MDATPAVPVGARDELDAQLAELLKEHARASGTRAVGPDGLLGRLAKRG
jgi:hypothetical protein